MTRTHKTISIAAGHDPSQLSKGQKIFNTRIKQIENLRARRAAWEAAIPPYQQKYASELLPLIEALMDLQVKLVHWLDRARDEKGLTKTERRTIKSVITKLAGELLAERDDTALKAVYNKNSRSDYDSEEAASLEDVTSMLETMLGVELGDDLDMNSPEDVLRRAQTQFEADQQAGKRADRSRKKSPKQLAREALQQAEEAQISQSIREVYRKLASALHPDREPDPQERDRKTALMQRANQAYNKKNLLQLLELQLGLEHIDQTAINNLSEDRLMRYNKILKEQLRELEQEILHVEGGFRMQFDIAPLVGLSPGTIMRNLASDIVGVRRAIRDLERDLLAFDEDIKNLKAWLKDLRHRPSMVGFDDMPF